MHKLETFVRVERRGFLCGAVGAVSLTALGGCLGSGDGTNSPRTVLGRWAPPREFLGSNSYIHSSWDGLAAQREQMNDGAVRKFSRSRADDGERIGVDPTSISDSLKIGSKRVILGSFDAETVTSTLENSGHQYLGGYEGYSVLRDYSGTVGVTDGVVILEPRTSDDGRERLEAVVDAGTGGPRQIDDDDVLYALLSSTEGNDMTVVLRFDSGSVFHPAGSVALSYGVRLGEDDVTLRYQYAFRSEEDAEVDPVREAFKEEDDYEEFTVTDTSVDGGLVSVVGTAPLEDFDGLIS